MLEGDEPARAVRQRTRSRCGAIESLVRQPNAGDLVLFGAYDGYEIVSFDDQIGAHGSAGGDQVWPFLIAPDALGIAGERIDNARDMHRVIMTRYARQRKGCRTPKG